jgi:hypothetical protein
LPVLDRAQIRQGISGWTDDPVAEDFADRASWRDLRFGGAGQRRDLGELIDRQLFRLFVADIIGELQLDVGEAEQRNRANRGDVLYR